jgi:hypothetical protein
MEAAEFTLGEACGAGVRRLFGAHPAPQVVERLEHELDLIRRRGLAQNFLDIAFAAIAAKGSGSMLGPGRGPSASSMVCYLLGVTNINPLDYGLVFELLLPTDGSALDVDIDVEDRWLRSIAPARAALSSAAFVHCLKIGTTEVDMLGLRTLDRIAETTRLVAAGGQVADLSRVPMDDDPTFDLLRAAATRDVFQLGSLGARRALRDLQPTTFDDLAALIALYRPSSLAMLREYIRRPHGSPTEWIDPVDALLAPTRGLLIYQEQLMEIAMQFAGFSGVMANSLRKTLGKRNAQRLKPMRRAFLDGADACGHDSASASRVWIALDESAGMAFSKAHAVAYAMLAYWDAYLAAHHAEARTEASAAFALSVDPWPRFPERGRAGGWTSIDVSLGSTALGQLVPPARAGEIMLAVGSSTAATTLYVCTLAASAALTGAHVTLCTFGSFVDDLRSRLAAFPSVKVCAGGAGVATWPGRDDFEYNPPRLLIFDRIDLDQTVLDAPSPATANQLGRDVSTASGLGDCAVVATVTAPGPSPTSDADPTEIGFGPLPAFEAYCDAIAVVDLAATEEPSLHVSVQKSRWGACGSVTVRTFSESELRMIDETVGDYCRRQSQHDDGYECRTGYVIEELGVTLFDEEPDWTGHGRLRRRPVAHFSLERTRGSWMLWWMSADMACIYPVLGGSDLASLVADVEEDEHGVFTN